MTRNTSIYLSRDFYTIILFIQLKNNLNIMRTRTCKSYYGNRMPNSENQHLKIKESTKTMFLFLVTESKVEKVVKGHICDWMD